MPRPFCRRRINWKPEKSNFFPEGADPDSADFIILSLDELEALRLVDLEGLYQEQAAEQMGISRPTLARILESARKKVADALVHSKGLRIGGGPVEFYHTPHLPGPGPSFPCRSGQSFRHRHGCFRRRKQP